MSAYVSQGYHRFLQPSLVRWPRSTRAVCISVSPVYRQALEGEVAAVFCVRVTAIGTIGKHYVWALCIGSVLNFGCHVLLQESLCVPIDLKSSAACSRRHLSGAKGHSNILYH